MDERWSFVGSKAHQRWLWHAMDHLSDMFLASAFGCRADRVFVKLPKLLKPFGLVHFYGRVSDVLITGYKLLILKAFKKATTILRHYHFYTDAATVYERHLLAAAHTIGKINTQQIERKHLMLRTQIKRLACKTLYFLKSVFMPDTVIALFMNRYGFSTPI